MRGVTPKSPFPAAARTYHAERFPGEAEAAAPAAVAAAAAGGPHADDVLHPEHHDHHEFLGLKRGSESGETQIGKGQSGIGLSAVRGVPPEPPEPPPGDQGGDSRAVGAGWESLLCSSPRAGSFSSAVSIVLRSLAQTSPRSAYSQEKSQGPSQFSLHHSGEVPASALSDSLGESCLF